MDDRAQGAFIEGEANHSELEAQRIVRLLALEVCPQRFGFVVFEGPVRLLDWGFRNYKGRSSLRRTALDQRISALLKSHTPTILVMRGRKSHSERARKRTLSATHTIREAARKSSVKVQLVHSREVRQFFSTHGCRTKHQIASLVATWFEELSWKLPPARKFYQTERSNTVVFDAVANGIAFFDRDHRQHPRGTDVH